MRVEWPPLLFYTFRGKSNKRRGNSKVRGRRHFSPEVSRKCPSLQSTPSDEYVPGPPIFVLRDRFFPKSLLKSEFGTKNWRNYSQVSTLSTKITITVLCSKNMACRTKFLIFARYKIENSAKIIAYKKSDLK